MDLSQRQKCLTDLRLKLAALTTEIVTTEDELAALEADAQLPLGKAPSTAKIPRTPAEKIARFIDLFGTRRSVYPKRWETAKPVRAAMLPPVTTTVLRIGRVESAGNRK